MGKITFITGGCRSGKSRYGQLLAESQASSRLFVATCLALDKETSERIARHQADRENRGWTVVEAPLDLCDAIHRADEDVLLVDCLTLWVNNLMFAAEENGEMFCEDKIAELANGLVNAAREFHGEIIFVTNEVGMGIVPDNVLARRFRDLAGRTNQIVAEAADDVVLMVSGIAVRIKASTETPEGVTLRLLTNN